MLKVEFEELERPAQHSPDIGILASPVISLCRLSFEEKVN
jgi:hypothetical protein